MGAVFLDARSDSRLVGKVGHQKNSLSLSCNYLDFRDTGVVKLGPGFYRQHRQFDGPALVSIKGDYIIFSKGLKEIHCVAFSTIQLNAQLGHMIIFLVDFFVQCNAVEDTQLLQACG